MTILLTPLGFPFPTDFQMIWISNSLILSMPCHDF